MQSFVSTDSPRAHKACATPGRIRFSRSSLIAFAYAAFIAAVLGLMDVQPRAGADVAVLAPPWSGPGRAAIIAAAGDGDIVGGTRFSFIVVAHPRSPRFVAEAYAHGAWLVFDAGLIAGCRSSGEAAAQY